MNHSSNKGGVQTVTDQGQLLYDEALGCNIGREDPGCGNCMERGPCKQGQSLLTEIPREISDASGKQESLSHT